MSSLITVPIFPLPGVLLAPNQLLPLHIFEPRYREMLAFALEHDERIAMAHPQPGAAGDSGVAPVFPVCGLGRIVRLEALDDGRANILLLGESRLRIVDELPKAHAFRLVSARPLDEVGIPEDSDELLRFRQALSQLEPRLLAELEDKPVQVQMDSLLPRLDADLEEKLRVYGDPDQNSRLQATLRLMGQGVHNRLDMPPDDPRRN